MITNWSLHLCKLMKPDNINTPSYWDGVYRTECESGVADTNNYSRDYGPIHDSIIGLIADGSSVLDVGCGPGLLCRKIRLQLPATRVTGVDFSAFTITRNSERDVELQIDYRQIDVRRELTTIGGPFDVVTMCEILEHLDEPEAVVADALSLVRPGGRFILSCPHDDEIPDPEHVREWGHDEVFHLLAPYADTISFVHFPPPYFHIWMMAYLSKSKNGAAALANQ